jgi:D-alanyl-D-alanine carboxypeptidase
VKIQPVLVVASLLLATPAGGTEASLAHRLQATVDEFLSENAEAPGIVVHFISPSRGLDWTAVAGREDRPEGSAALTMHHTFRIASNTKTYVAASVMRLVESGGVQLDDNLAQHLPARYRDLLGDDGYDLEAMTLAQVLSHTSGLFEHPADPRYAAAILADPQHHWTADEQVQLCVEWGDPVGLPGGEYIYSDTGYVLLGAIIEAMTGQRLGRAVHSLLSYEDLDLPSTWWELDEEQPPAAGPRAHQYYGDYDTIDWHPSLDLYGGGGLLTDARDLAWFLRKLLAGEVFDRPETLAQMTGRGSLSYRLGLMRKEMSGHLAWGHTGFWNTFAFHVPTLDLTVAGAVLDHRVERGQVLAERLVEVFATAE